MKPRGILICLIAGFMLGYLAHAAASLGYIGFGESAEVPAINSPENLVDTLTLSSSPERISPANWVPEGDIHVYNDRVVLEISNPEWAGFTNTNSMDPVLDDTSHAIEIVPKSSDDVHIGDIASYQNSNGESIIHRVIGKGQDGEGVFYIFKGDNNPARDPGKIRFSQIQRIVVAVIY